MQASARSPNKTHIHTHRTCRGARKLQCHACRLHCFVFLSVCQLGVLTKTAPLLAARHHYHLFFFSHYFSVNGIIPARQPNTRRFDNERNETIRTTRRAHKHHTFGDASGGLDDKEKRKERRKGRARLLLLSRRHDTTRHDTTRHDTTCAHGEERTIAGSVGRSVVRSFVRSFTTSDDDDERRTRLLEHGCCLNCLRR